MTEERAEYTALAVAPQNDGMTLMQLGEMLSKSGYFQDAKGAAQAIVKVLAGRELGIGPIAAMTGISIIQGRVSVGANIMAAKVKGSGKYDYRVRELTDARCVLEFYQRNGDEYQAIGVSEFTIDNARLAATKNLDKFPRNMLFARAISNGVKWYCPDISVSPMYTPDELGATVDYETGEIVTSTATDVTPEPAHTNGGGKAVVDKAELERAKSAFFQKVLAEIPYYTAIQHVGNTLKQAGFTAYSPDNEPAMWDALQAYANTKANEAAAEPTKLDDLVNQGEVPA